jgi:hypothetical protein
MHDEFLDENAPDWRWQIVTSLVDDNKPPSRRTEDDDFRKAWYYLKRANTVKSRYETLALSRDYPGLARAHKLYENPNSVKWIIEAGLLTDITIEDLSKFVSQPKDVVENYVKYFYDVRDKLESRGYIINYITLPAVRRGLAQRDFDFLYKTMAYCCGWNHFVSLIDNKAMDEETTKFFQNGFKQNLIKLGYISTLRIEVNNFTAAAIMEMNVKLLDLERDKASESVQSQAVAMLGEVLSNCKMAIIPSSKTLLSHEPRADELMRGVSRLKYGEAIPIGSK